MASRIRLLSPAAPPNTVSPVSLSTTTPAVRRIGHAHGLVDRHRLPDLEIVAQRPGEIGQLVGEPLGESPGRRR